MVDALIDLEDIFRSKREEFTLQEANVIRAYKARLQSYFFVGLGGASAVTWLVITRAFDDGDTIIGIVIHLVYGRENESATQRLHNKPLRNSLTLGAGTVCAFWLSTRSLESSVEQILSLEGTKIQRELANIMLKKHHDNPWVRRVVSKHFYPEKVYVDSSADKPIFRWRYRNSSGEPIARTESYGADEKETDPKEKKIDNTPKQNPGQQVSVNAAADAGTGDPFDVVLGVGESTDDDGDDPQPQPTNAPLEPSRRQTRKEKRSRRRRRRQHRREESEDESEI